MRGNVDEQVPASVARVSEQARRRLGGAEGELAARFIEEYLRDADPADLDARPVDDIYGALMAHWQLGRVRGWGVAKVKVLNPDLETTGWRSPHTVVLIVNDDMPFLVDAVRLTLNRHGLGIHLMVHPMLRVERDGDGRIVDVGEGTDPERAAVEAWTIVEIDRIGGEQVELLTQELLDALAAVRPVVEDRDAMRARATALAEELDGTPGAGDAPELLRWLVGQRFVFLGAARYSFEGGATPTAPVEGSQLGLLRAPHPIDPPFTDDGSPLSITRSVTRSSVYRPQRLAVVRVRHRDGDGKVVAEDRIVGLFAASAYRQSVTTVPMLRETAEQVLERSGFAADTHTGRELRAVLEGLPRDELFEMGPDDLYDLAIGVVSLQERQRVRVFEIREPTNRFVTALVFLPKSRFTSAVAATVASVVQQAYDGVEEEHDTTVGLSTLARIHVVVLRQPGPAGGRDPELDHLAQRIDELTTSWSDRLRAEVTAVVGERDGHALLGRFGEDGIPAEYQAVTDPRAAVNDLRRLAALDPEHGLATSLLARVDGPPDELRFKLYRRGDPLTLSAVLPLLENLGLTVVDERPFELRPVGEPRAWVYDIGVRLPSDVTVDPRTSEELQATFRSSLRGDVDNDGLNRLVLLAGMTGRQVAIVRTYVKYLRQIGFPFSQSTIEATLARHAPIVAMIAQLFDARLDPVHAEGRDEAVTDLVQQVSAALDDVPSLDDDRVGRALLGLVNATLRTNAFQADRPVIAVKLDPTQVPDLPQPRPMFEIFVYAPRVEGVHLRGGRIARGGLRWSDRREDFRTEILGLMKAQMVKNAVIVPVGAKGGFVVKRPPRDPEAMRVEVVTCYRQFVAGLLDLTDNIVGDAVVPPAATVRYDGDDPYLVVAADKGTATFSDIANEISAKYGFWLGDAFASGGSTGYDHKEMGITARGAWESVRRHARAISKDADRGALTVVGIGDMSGDVFGNGMLRSEHLQLVAAFDHRHVFLDPTPDAAVSFAERRRLFELPRSSWADYDPSLISDGGGVFARTLKHIELTPQVRQVLATDATVLTPAELISAILRAPVDLLWNGGIGTYVKASSETHADVGDRANDSLRVNGNELRCKIVAEGGNLGLTQRGRVEYALAGGLVNTDAIDNSAGVDCSDHEVNIKILLDSLVAAGDLTVKQRNELLATMTGEVAELVLDDNRAQTLALALARRQAAPMVNVHARYIHQLEVEGWLDRELEALPTDKQLADRQAAGGGLTTPEFAVMLAYTKLADIAEIEQTDLADDAYLEPELVNYFPKEIQRFSEAIHQHRLRREITVTQVVNQMVNLSGTSFDHRMTEETGALTVDVTRAWIAARDIFGLPALWESIEALGASVPLDAQVSLFLESRRLVERSVMWLLRHRRPPLPIGATVAELRPGVQALMHELGPLLRGPLAEQTFALAAERVVAGVPAELAERSSVWPVLHTAFDMVEIARAANVPVERAAAAYWDLFEQLDLAWLWNAIGRLPRNDRWQTHARAAMRDDLLTALADLAAVVVEANASAAQWAAASERPVQRAREVFNELRRMPTYDLTTVAVALRQLHNLVLSSEPGS
jgi:glutamate dehydrogenase